MVAKPAKIQMTTLINVGLWNWNKSRKNGMFKIRVKNKIAPPVTHITDLLWVIMILNILSVHDRFVSITAIFETIKVINAMARTSLGSYPWFKARI